MGYTVGGTFKCSYPSKCNCALSHSARYNVIHGAPLRCFNYLCGRYSPEFVLVRTLSHRCTVNNLITTPLPPISLLRLLTDYIGAIALLQASTRYSIPRFSLFLVPGAAHLLCARACWSPLEFEQRVYICVSCIFRAAFYISRLPKDPQLRIVLISFHSDCAFAACSFTQGNAGT